VRYDIVIGGFCLNSETKRNGIISRALLAREWFEVGCVVRLVFGL